METRNRDRNRSLASSSRNLEKQRCRKTGSECVTNKDWLKQTPNLEDQQERNTSGGRAFKTEEKRHKGCTYSSVEEEKGAAQSSDSLSKGTKRSSRTRRKTSGTNFSKKARKSLSDLDRANMSQRGTSDTQTNETRKSVDSRSSSSSHTEYRNAFSEAQGISSPENYESSSSRRLTTSTSIQGLLRRLGTGFEDLFVANRGIRTSQLLNDLRDSNDEFKRIAALNDLCEYLSIGTEESLLSFQVDSFVPILVSLLEPTESPDTMLLAARALSHMIEALPHSAAAVAHHGAPTVLCNALLSIQYIDLAEQALTALDKISREFPGPVLRAGGLMAVLTYIDFFSTGVQRTAASTAANLCRTVASDAFHLIQEALPLLFQLLSSEDSRIREYGITAFTRLADSFRWQSDELIKVFSLGDENAMDFPVLTRMLDMLALNASGLSGHSISDILNLLSNAARGSAVLLKQILTEERTNANGFTVTLVGLLRDLLEESTVACSATDILQLADAFVAETEESGDYSNPVLRRIAELYRLEVYARHSDRNRSQTERDRKKMLLENPEILYHYGTQLFPQFIKLFKSSSSTIVKRQIMSCMRKFVGCARNDILEAALFDRDSSDKDSSNTCFIPFISSLLSFNGSKMENAFGAYLAVACMNKLKEALQTPFMREGVFHELRRLKERCELSEDEDASNLALIENIHSILEFYSELETRHSMNPFFDQLQDIGEWLNRVSDEEIETSGEEKMKSLLNMFYGEKSVSRFEIIQSDTITSIAAFLRGDGTEVSRKKRLMLFARCASCNLEGFRNLVLKIMDVLAATEDVPVASADMTVGTALHLLHQPLKFKLKQRSRTRNALSLSVSIEPLTSMSNIERFVLKRLEEKNNSYRTRRRTRSMIRCYQSSSWHRWTPSDTRHSGGELEDESDEVTGIEEGWESTQESSSSYGSPEDIVSLRRTLSIAEDDEEGSVSESEEQEEEEEESHQFIDVTTSIEAEEEGDSMYNGDTLSSSLPAVELNLENISHEAACSSQNQELSPFLLSLMSQQSNAPEEEYTGPVTRSRSNRPSQKRLVFFMNDYRIPSHYSALMCVTNFSSALHEADPPVPDPSLWDAFYTLEFSEEEISASEEDCNLDSFLESIHSLSQHSYKPAQIPAGFAGVAADCVTVLNDLFIINRIGEDDKSTKLMRESIGNVSRIISEEVFCSQKLSAKLIRQLSDPVILASASYPRWITTLPRYFPFLFPFETRQLAFQLSFLGIARAFRKLQQRAEAHNHLHHPRMLRGGSSLASFFSLNRRLDRYQDRESILGRLPRQKVRISRDCLLRSGMKAMELYCDQKSILEIEFFDEVGTGLGPTLEFYTLVSRELQRSDLGLWRSVDSCYTMTQGEVISPKRVTNRKQKRKNQFSWRSLENAEEKKYAQPPGNGLFPKAIAIEDNSRETQQILEMFHFMGKFCAKALLDGRLVDLRLSLQFVQLIFAYARERCHCNKQFGEELSFLSNYVPSIENLAQVDPVLASSLQTMLELKDSLEDGSSKDDKQDIIEDLCVYFTVPGAENVELIEHGSSCPVTSQNVNEYVTRVCRYLLVDGVCKQAAAFCTGCEEILDLQCLLQFMPEELETLLCGPNYERWDWNSLVAATKCDHGYTHESTAVQYLFQVLSTYNLEQQRMFLTFVTGSPRLPVGGLAALTPRLTIVKRTPEAGRSPDECLPTVMTCTNYLKLPEYSSFEVTKQRLEYAIREGQGSFHLS